MLLLRHKNFFSPLKKEKKKKFFFLWFVCPQMVPPILDGAWSADGLATVYRSSGKHCHASM